MKKLVLVVDVQRDFMCTDGALAVPGAEALIAPMNDLLAGLSPEDSSAVLLTFDTHIPDAYAISPEAERFPPHCVRGSHGWESVLDIASIDPAIPLFRLEKSVFDMWAEAGLIIEDVRRGAAEDRDIFFQGLRETGVDHALVIGVAADFCVRWAIAGLLARGFEVEIPAALTRGIERQIDAVKDEAFAGAALTVV